MKRIFSIITIGSILFGCNNSKKMASNTDSRPSPSAEKSTRDFDKEGHRGCRGLMPENTIPAMLKALNLGVTTLEMDIVFTKDQQAILSHEPFFNHEITTKPDGTFIDEKSEKDFNIYEMNYEEVKKYDVGLKPHPRFPGQEKIQVCKPLLSEVFTAVKKDMMTRRRPFPFYNIETKTTPATDGIYHPGPEKFVDQLMKVIRENDMDYFVIIQSFDFRTLQYLHQHYPGIKTALLIEGSAKESMEEQLKKLGFTPTIYSPAFELVTEPLIRSCHQKDMKIIPWTVNDKQTIDRLKQWSVDGIITDYPNLFND